MKINMKEGSNKYSDWGVDKKKESNGGDVVVVMIIECSDV